MVDSSPLGGSVEVLGPIKAVGITPFYAPRFPVGSYEVSVGRQGYYTRRTRVLLNSGDSIHVDAQLRPKSAAGGFIRSVVFPGWGQRFNERPGRGAFYTGAEIAAAGVATYLWTQYNHSVTRYNRIADSLAFATTVDDVTLYTRKLAERDASVQKHKDNTRTAVYVAAGVWVVNALDALVFGPVREELPSVSLESVPVPSVASVRPDASRVGFVVRF